MSTTSQVFVPEIDAKSMDEEFHFRSRRKRPTSELIPGDGSRVNSGAVDASSDLQRIKTLERLSEHAEKDIFEVDTRIEKDDDPHKQHRKREGEHCEDNIDASVELDISKPGVSIQVGDINGDQQKEEELEEENDGFRTPENKIPSIQRCPPAPKKPRSEPSLLKRSRAYSACCRIRIDVSDLLLESLFQPVLASDLSPSIKKARKSNLQ